MIGIIGYGVVGKSMREAFGDFPVAIIDPIMNVIKYEDLSHLNVTEIFVCVPAPTLDDKSVDISIIEDVLTRLSSVRYKGVVVLKSTITPARILYLVDVCKEIQIRLVYSPEFIREAHWQEDALNPDMIILAGNEYDCNQVKSCYRVFSSIKNLNFRDMNYVDASLTKYAVNTFLATKVVYFNQLYQLYQDIHGSADRWDDFINTLSNDSRMGTSHMNVPGPDAQYGFGGTCFPKDVKALIGADGMNRMTILKEALVSNEALRQDTA